MHFVLKRSEPDGSGHHPEICVLSAGSRDLFGNDKMWFIRTAKMGTNTLGQLLSGKQPVGFHHGTLAMNPPGFNRVEPGTFGRQVARQDANALALRFPWALCWRIQVRTSLLTCQEALSQMSNHAVFPRASSCSHPHWRNCMVRSLTGRPVTKRSDI